MHKSINKEATVFVATYITEAATAEEIRERTYSRGGIKSKREMYRTKGLLLSPPKNREASI